MARGSTPWACDDRWQRVTVASAWVAWASIAAACATAPPAAVTPPVVTWEQKLDWIVRLEDQRIIRDPNPPAPVILVPAAKGRPAVVAPPPPSDLLRLLRDDEARTRRRAALALGRVGLSGAVPGLIEAMDDPEFEVRQMAAFALGLLGDESARPRLLTALNDASPIVRGRAAEALGTLGNRADASPIAAMVRAGITGGALSGVAPDDLSWPMAPAVEATRLGLFALARLGSYEATASAVLGPNGEALVQWWPVAYALGRGNDARAAVPLQRLLATPGRFTAGFAARGLGALKAAGATAALREIVSQQQRDPAVVIEAMRALASVSDAEAAPALTRLVTGQGVDPTVRREAVQALATLHAPATVDLMVDLLSHDSPDVRAAAIGGLAATDPATFLTVLSGLDPDEDWTVRVSLAEALTSLPAGQGIPRLFAMLRDRDARVLAGVLRSLAAAKAPDAERILLDRLQGTETAVQIAAAEGLGALKATNATQALTAAYRAASGDASYVVRAAILTALDTINSASARPLLEEALRDREWALRVKALSLLRGEGAGAPADIRPAPERPMADADRSAMLAPAYSPLAILETDKGTVEVELAILDAPMTVTNFMLLARKGFFDGLTFHRVVPDFVVQGGDPEGDGQGGPGYTIRDELSELPYLRGTVGMALDWNDTGGSQFFITHSPQPHLDGRYTAFGRVTSGMDVVDRIQPGDVIRRVRIWDGTTPP